MLVNARSLTGYALNAACVNVGDIRALCFSVLKFCLRYIIAFDAEREVADPEILVSPHGVGRISQSERSMEILVSKQRLNECPQIHFDASDSRDMELDYHKYFDWPVYWNGPMMWGLYPTAHPPIEGWNLNPDGTGYSTAKLMCTDDVLGYEARGIDGGFGHVDDFIIDLDTWAVRYFVINSHHWWPGRKVLISTQWIERESWEVAKVFVNLSREDVKNAPEFTDSTLLDREFEAKLHGYYDRQGYWVGS